MADLVIHPDGWRTYEPKPSAEALKAFYAQEYFQKSHGTYAEDYTAEERAHRSLLATVMLEALAQAGASQGELLEVGCGEGWFLEAADRVGYAVHGLDFSDDGLRRFHPAMLGRVTIGDAFENLDRLIAAGDRRDVCVMEHVLEHVVDPEGLLHRLHGLLKPGGLLAVTVPNDFSPLQQKALAAGVIDRPFWLAPPQHLNYFNSNNLTAFLRRMGFHVRFGFSSFPIDWFLMHPGSNYVADGAAGKPAHRARMAIDLMLAEQGMEAFLGLAKALFECGAGRSLTVIAAAR